MTAAGPRPRVSTVDTLPVAAGRLADRPPIAVPRPRGAGPARPVTQPALGLLGLLLVLPVAAALALGAGADGSTLVLAPLVVHALPLVVVVAFWWEDWPGTRLRAGWAGWADTALIAAGAVLLTAAGQAVAGHVDLLGLFDPSPGPGHVPTFPATLPLAGTAFIAMLEITLVGEGWPLRRLRPVPAGLLAVAISWAIALVVLVTVVEVVPPAGSGVTARHGPVAGAELGAVLVLIGAWQVLCYVTWHGWPFASIARRPVRLVTAHVVVLGGGIASYVLARRLLGSAPVRIAAVAGCFIAAGLLLGMLLEGWFGNLPIPAERAALLLGTLALTAVLAAGLGAAADAVGPSRVSADDWVQHASLNALSTAIILHVGVGRRWPFRRGPRVATSETAARSTGDVVIGRPGRPGADRQAPRP
jgi:hypothetical protein